MSIDQSHPVDRSADPANSPTASSAQSLDADQSLNESELKYQRLVEGIGGDYAIYTHDPDGEITYVSPSIEALLGYPVKSLLGLNWRELIGEHFVGRELADRVEDEVAAGKNFYKFQVEIAHADGSTRLIEIQQRPLFDSAGEYKSMEGIARDITIITRNAEELKKLKQDLEQRVAERTAELIRSNERLRESESRYRNVVDCQTDFVVRWLPGAIFTFVNEAFCRLIGKSSDELIGWCFLPLVHPEDASAFREVIAQLSLEKQYADFENRLVLPDGRHVWTHWTNQMLFDDGGNFLEYQSVGRDITELRTAADVIREKEAHLAHMSRLATMGELVAGMAHEIHQPLHAAKTFAEAARRNLEMGLRNAEIQTADPVETAIDCTKEISNAISRTAKIIRRLREFTHSRPVKLDELDLNQVVREATALIAYETRTARVKLIFELVSGIPLIQGDRIQLQQACVNILINAYEAMVDTPAEQRKIVLSTQYDNWQVRLLFEDVGCGIAEEDQEKLFDAFYTTKPQGMGMGLSLCKSITEAHGGRVFAKRNEGVGMTFVLELPIMKRPAGLT
ncbi:MAG: PAS domain S-box protein [Bythopirellula sp.]